MKAPKPTKKDILSELESIRHSLLAESTQSKAPNNAKVSSHTQAPNSENKSTVFDTKLIDTTRLNKHVNEELNTALDELSLDENLEADVDLSDEDIPTLDDLVIDDNSCPDAIEEVVSKLDASSSEQLVSNASTDKQSTQGADGSSTKQGNGERDKSNDADSDTTSPNPDESQVNTSPISSSPISTSPQGATQSDTSWKSASEADTSNEEFLTVQSFSDPTPIRKTTIERSKTQPKNQAESVLTNVLPGQQSLFDDEFEAPCDAQKQTTLSESNTEESSNLEHCKARKKERDAKSKNDTANKNHTLNKAVKQTNKNLFDKQPNQSSHNPFLPPHIRERLAKQKIVLEDDAKAHQNALATLKSSVSMLTGKAQDSRYNSSYLDIEDLADPNIEQADSLLIQTEEITSPTLDPSLLVEQVLKENADLVARAKEKAEITLPKIEHNLTPTSDDTNPLVGEMFAQLMPMLERALRQKLEDELNNTKEPSVNSVNL